MPSECRLHAVVRQALTLKRKVISQKTGINSKGDNRDKKYVPQRARFDQRVELDLPIFNGKGLKRPVDRISRRTSFER